MNETLNAIGKLEPLYIRPIGILILIIVIGLSLWYLLNHPHTQNPLKKEGTSKWI